jgi:ABC-type sulfate transport system permease component
MESAILGIIWLMLFSIGLLVMIVYLRRYSNEERMAMIEKGVEPMDFKTSSNTSFSLRFALLLIGGGLGLLVAYFLDSAFGMEEVAYFSMLLLFGGAGLGLSYIIEEKKASKA